MTCVSNELKKKTNNFEEKKMENRFIYSNLNFLNWMACTDFVGMELCCTSYNMFIITLFILHKIYMIFLHINFKWNFLMHFICKFAFSLLFLTKNKSMFISFIYIYALYHISFTFIAFDCVRALFLSLSLSLIFFHFIFDAILFNGSLLLVFKPIFTVIRL